MVSQRPAFTCNGRKDHPDFRDSKEKPKGAPPAAILNTPVSICRSEITSWRPAIIAAAGQHTEQTVRVRVHNGQLGSARLPETFFDFFRRYCRSQNLHWSARCVFFAAQATV
jgi:hypothetical protein